LGIGFRKTTGAFALSPRESADLRAGSEGDVNRPFPVTVGVLLLAVLPLTSPQICLAQDGRQPSAADKDRGPKQTDSSTKPPGRKRMFGLMPAYGVVDAGLQPPPLTSGRKFKLALQYIDPYTFGFVSVEAGLNQAFDGPKEYGQGAEGYGKRYGAGFGDGLTNSIFTTGVYPTLLRQDPRYYRRGEGEFSHRMAYAASRTLVTRQDSGRPAFNFSEVLGNFTSSSIALTYYPASQRDFSNVARRAGIQLGFDAGLNLLKEFYPDIERKLFGRKRTR
jgi:hypothetical protein